jgi:hypothetical protein
MKGFEKPQGRWVNPTLSAVVLTGCLMTGHPAVALVTAPDSASVAQVHTQSTRSSMTDLLHAALGTALAAAWLMGRLGGNAQRAHLHPPQRSRRRRAHHSSPMNHRDDRVRD